MVEWREAVVLTILLGILLSPRIEAGRFFRVGGLRSGSRVSMGSECGLGYAPRSVEGTVMVGFGRG